MNIREVTLTKKVEKALKRLPRLVKDAFFVLLKDIEESGAVRGNWPNYGKLSKQRHHCHIRKGHPTYVACWKKVDGKNNIEVDYVGTHEKAPY